MSSFLYEPIFIQKKGVCPICLKANLCVKSLEANYYILDQNANPYHTFATEGVFLTMCPKCGFKSNDFYPTKDGFKFTPKWDLPEYKNQVRLDSISTIEEKTFTGNPFIKEDDE